MSKKVVIGGVFRPKAQRDGSRSVVNREGQLVTEVTDKTAKFAFALYKGKPRRCVGCGCEIVGGDWAYRVKGKGLMCMSYMDKEHLRSMPDGVREVSRADWKARHGQAFELPDGIGHRRTLGERDSTVDDALGLL